MHTVYLLDACATLVPNRPLARVLDGTTRMQLIVMQNDNTISRIYDAFMDINRGT